MVTKVVATDVAPAGRGQGRVGWSRPGSCQLMLCATGGRQGRIGQGRVGQGRVCRCRPLVA